MYLDASIYQNLSTTVGEVMGGEVFGGEIVSGQIISGELIDSVLASANEAGWLTSQLLGVVRGGAEWVLWLLLALLIGIFVVFFERLIFYRSVSVDGDALRAKLRVIGASDDASSGAQDAADSAETGGDAEAGSDRNALVSSLETGDSMQERVLAYGLADADRGPEAVQSLCDGAVGREKLRYEKRLSFLATVGSNAPFIGLFGTVIGVIMAFEELQKATGAGQSGASGGGVGGGVMAAIAEALVATGVGLLVAIPAIILYNLLKTRVKAEVTDTGLLVNTAVAYLRADDGSTDRSGTESTNEPTDVSE